MDPILTFAKAEGVLKEIKGRSTASYGQESPSVWPTCPTCLRKGRNECPEGLFMFLLIDFEKLQVLLGVPVLVLCKTGELLQFLSILL